MGLSASGAGIVAAHLFQFPQSAVSTFDEAWGAREGAMKSRGYGKDKTRDLWNKEARRVGGHDVLLAALKRFFREKPEKDGYTHPGLSVWLNQQRADHWIEAVEREAERVEREASHPFPAIRANLVKRLGEPFVRSYIDPASMIEVDGRVLITPATDYGRRKIEENKAALKASGVFGMRQKQSPPV